MWKWWKCTNLSHVYLQIQCVKMHFRYSGVSLNLNISTCVFFLPVTLNLQSSPGWGPRSPAAVGFPGAASPALSSPLYPAGPSLLAAGPYRTSSQPRSRGPDAQQTWWVLTRKEHLISHGCTQQSSTQLIRLALGSIKKKKGNKTSPQLNHAKCSFHQNSCLDY